MADLYKVTIGLGDRKGNTRHVIKQESKSRIAKQSAKDGNMQNPRIKLKQLPQIQMGGLALLLRNRMGKHTLETQLKINDQDSNYHKINKRNEELMKNILDQEQMLGIFQQENQKEKQQEQQNQRFIKETGAAANIAREYRNKYKNVDQAIKMYKEHQSKIEKFMKTNNCDRDNAVAFLESNNYDMSAFE